jgi:hypothetical protein
MRLFKPAYKRDPRWILSNYRGLNPQKSAHYVAVKALHKMRDEVGQAALRALINVQRGPDGDPNNIAHMAGEIAWRIKSFGLGADVMAITALLSIAENDDYRSIAAEIEPLIKAVEALDAKEEAERLKKQRALADLEIARQAAKERALANIENDREVISARERLEQNAIAAGAGSM